MGGATVTTSLPHCTNRPQLKQILEKIKNTPANYPQGLLTTRRGLFIAQIKAKTGQAVTRPVGH